MSGAIYDVADGDALVDDGHIVYTAVRRCRGPRARAPNISEYEKFLPASLLYTSTTDRLSLFLKFDFLLSNQYLP